MRVYFVSGIEKGNTFVYDGDEFSTLSVEEKIDNYYTCQFGFNVDFFEGDASVINNFDDIYVVDDNGDVIFGGILTGYTVTDIGGQMNAFDHRWELSRLILDEEFTISESDDVIEKIKELLELASNKRDIPLVLDEERSEINPELTADLKFNIGDTIASVIKKIVKTTESRWAVRYKRVDNEFVGELFIRSIFGVSPEGVGISRSHERSEDGERINLFYEEGNDRSNITSFEFNSDYSKMNTRTKVAGRIGGETQHFDVAPDFSSSFYELFFGITEEFMSDYKINSADTAQTVGQINQTRPRQDFNITLRPDFDKRLHAGDRVTVETKTRLLENVGKLTARLDAVTRKLQDGNLVTEVYANPANPQKETARVSVVQEVNNLKSRLDGLDKDYLGS